jgi:hypothetical protein
VQNFFIDMLPLFASALVSLIIMLHQLWIGHWLIIIPIYFYQSKQRDVAKAFQTRLL